MSSPAARAPDLQPGVCAELRGVYKQFDGNPVLEGVDLAVREGEITVVIGGSGSGKTTTMRVLLGLETYDAGSARLLGQEVGELRAAEHAALMMRVGSLFQFGALFDSMTVAENVGFALHYVQHRPADEIRGLVRENLMMVGLKDIEHLYPAQLSGGMRKRVALARAIAHQPEILFVDEPTTGLDPVMKETIVELILQMRDRLGVSVLCITHDLAAAFRIADHVAMVYQGKVVASGTPGEVRESEHPAVRQFVGGRSYGPIDP